MFAQGVWPGLQDTDDKRCHVKSSLPGILSTGSDELAFRQVLDRYQQLLEQDLSPANLAHFTLHETQAELLLFGCSSSFGVIFLAAALR